MVVGPKLVVMLLAVVLVGYSLVGQVRPTSADTQYFGGIEGKTYLSNWNGDYHQGVWGSTWVTSGAYVSTLRVELHPQWYCQGPAPWCPFPYSVGWNDASTQVVDQFANYVSTAYYNGSHAARGWSWHKNWFSGDQGTTSDGY